MAIEIMLLYTLQILYGYVYGMVGLAIGIFMFGLVLGSALMNRYLGAQSPSQSPSQGFKVLFALDISLASFAATLPWVMGLLQASALYEMAQTILFCLVGVTGVIGGLLFPLAAFVRLNDQTSTARAAAAVDTADHVGAAVGALVTGVVLVPVVGLTGTCMVIALMKMLSSLFVAGAAATKLEPQPSH
jgi:spermidine synthase